MMENFWKLFAIQNRTLLCILTFIGITSYIIEPIFIPWVVSELVEYFVQNKSLIVLFGIYLLLNLLNMGLRILFEVTYAYFLPKSKLITRRYLAKTNCYLHLTSSLTHVFLNLQCLFVRHIGPSFVVLLVSNIIIWHYSWLLLLIQLTSITLGAFLLYIWSVKMKRLCPAYLAAENKITLALSNIANAMIAIQIFSLVPKRINVLENKESAANTDLLFANNRYGAMVLSITFFFQSCAFNLAIYWLWQCQDLSLTDVIFLFNLNGGIIISALYIIDQLPHVVFNINLFHNLQHKYLPHQLISKFEYLAIDLISYLHITYDLKIKLLAGQKLFIKGSPGSGKTTLMSIILGQVNNYQGSILINNQYTTLSHYGLFSYVGSWDSLLLDDTVSDNCPNEELLGLFRLDKNYMVSKLSSGQKQKLLLARAINKQAEILLLDEPFNYLDDKDIELVLKLLEKYYITKTVICIDHREILSQYYRNREIEICNIYL